LPAPAGPTITSRTRPEAATAVTAALCVTRTLLSNGRYRDAVAIVREGVVDAADLNDPDGLSVTGRLMLVGATASARAGERAEVAAVLQRRSVEDAGYRSAVAESRFGATLTSAAGSEPGGGGPIDVCVDMSSDS
jgi:hypothetical protein